MALGRGVTLTAARELAPPTGRHGFHELLDQKTRFCLAAILIYSSMLNIFNSVQGLLLKPCACFVMNRGRGIQSFVWAIKSEKTQKLILARDGSN